MTARLLAWTGATIALLGVVDLIWLQSSTPFPGGSDASWRWQLATGPLIVTGVGVVIVGIAQVLVVLIRGES